MIYAIITAFFQDAQMVYWANFSLDYLLLCSIPGVGEATATTLLAEIGDIKRFPSSKQLVAFAGIDPSVFESGNEGLRDPKALLREEYLITTFLPYKTFRQYCYCSKP